MAPRRNLLSRDALDDCNKDVSASDKEESVMGHSNVPAVLPSLQTWEQPKEDVCLV